MEIHVSAYLWAGGAKREMISEVKQYGEQWRVSDTYSGARGSGGAGFAIFAGQTLRGSKINEMRQEGTKKRLICRMPAFHWYYQDPQHDRSRAAGQLWLRVTFKGAELEQNCNFFHFYAVFSDFSAFFKEHVRDCRDLLWDQALQPDLSPQTCQVHPNRNRKETLQLVTRPW